MLKPIKPMALSDKYISLINKFVKIDILLPYTLKSCENSSKLKLYLL